MKCLSAVALFCLIAIASAGILGDSAIPVLHRLRRETQSFQSSSSSSQVSSSQSAGGPVHFQQQSATYFSGSPNAPVGLADRFGPDDGVGNQGVGQITSVSGTYDPNSQQTYIHQNYHQQFPFQNGGFFPNPNYPNPPNNPHNNPNNYPNNYPNPPNKKP